ncbi:MAG: hypothetical protein NTW87_28805 [Planctomycetota bacterium]|nr:hypothetical protein [Planctomycetota bacterium]
MALSNGEPFTGEVWFTDGKLRLYEGEGAAGGRYVNIAQNELVSITFIIKEKSLESPWRFKNAGSDEKEILPGKYPMINLGSEVKLTSGKVLAGHLMTTPVFVRIPGRENPMDFDNKKFILKYQYKGELGQEFKDVTYVSSIVFNDNATVAAAENGSIGGTIKGVGKLEQAAAFGIERMAGYLGKVDAEKGTYCIENLPKDVYDIALLTDQGVYVGLSDVSKTVKGQVRPLTPEDEQAIAKQLAKYEDFFDQQQILGVKGHCEAAKVLVHQWRVREQHDEEGLKGKQIHRLDIWCWHKRTTEWHTDKQGRAQLFRYMEPREGQKRAIRLVKEFGGVRVEPAEKKAVEVNYGGTGE